jgi:glycosyltransferase involved in cell wall biosynthesis
MTNKIKILVISDFYLPSFKAGGPIKSISNIVEQLIDYEFYIFTQNHDLGSVDVFENIDMNSWNIVGNAKVFYADKNMWNFKGLQKILNETQHEILYLNSFFNFKSSILPILIKYFKPSNTKILIAPRGEFSPGALNIKFKKKILYIFLSKLSGLYKNVFWQASSRIEANHIVKYFNTKKVTIAPNLLSSKFNKRLDVQFSNITGPLRILFLSRISPKKNLKFLIKCLFELKSNVILNIYGTIEDQKYWDECLFLIKKAPNNVKIFYKGQADPINVSTIFLTNDVFIFPTLGENFGHVIFESLSNSTPIIISDQTPWVECENKSVIVLPLKQEIWVKEIEKISLIDRIELLQRRKHANEYINKYINSNNSIELNKILFNSLTQFKNENKK